MKREQKIWLYLGGGAVLAWLLLSKSSPIKQYVDRAVSGSGGDSIASKISGGWAVPAKQLAPVAAGKATDSSGMAGKVAAPSFGAISGGGGGILGLINDIASIPISVIQGVFGVGKAIVNGIGSLFSGSGSSSSSAGGVDTSAVNPATWEGEKTGDAWSAPTWEGDKVDEFGMPIDNSSMMAFGGENSFGGFGDPGGFGMGGGGGGGSAAGGSSGALTAFQVAQGMSLSPGGNTYFSNVDWTQGGKYPANNVWNQYDGYYAAGSPGQSAGAAMASMPSIPSFASGGAGADFGGVSGDFGAGYGSGAGGLA